MATNADINAWLAANPNATDQQRRYAMNQYGVTPEQLAGATGMDPNQVMQRYQAAHYGSDDINGWLQRNPGASDGTMRQVMDQYGVSPYDVSAATGTNLGQVTSRYEAAGAPVGASQAANVMPAGGYGGNTQVGASPNLAGPAGTVNPMGATSSPSGVGLGAQGGYMGQNGVPGTRIGRPVGAGGQGGSAYGQQAPYGGAQNAMMRGVLGGGGANTGMADQQPNAMVGAMYPGRRGQGFAQ